MKPELPWLKLRDFKSEPVDDDESCRFYDDSVVHKSYDGEGEIGYFIPEDKAHCLFEGSKNIISWFEMCCGATDNQIVIGAISLLKKGICK